MSHHRAYEGSAKGQRNIINVWTCYYFGRCKAWPFFFSGSAGNILQRPSEFVQYAYILVFFFNSTSRGIAILSYFDACSTNVYPGSCLHLHIPSARLLLTNAMDLKVPNPAMKSPMGTVVVAMVIAMIALFMALDTAALGIRLWSRRLQGFSLCFNDYAVLLAWVCTATHFST